MKRAVFLTCIISIFCLSSASDEWVRGTVTDQDGNPVAGAFIKLKNRNSPAVFTNGNGVFSLIESADVNTQRIKKNAILNLRPAGKETGFILESDGTEKEISLEIFDLSGTRIHAERFIDRKGLNRKITLNNTANGLYVVKAVIPGGTLIWRVGPGIVSRNSRSAQKPASKAQKLGKKTDGFIDTVIVVSRMHRHALVGIENYTTDNLQITLSPSNLWIPSPPLEYSGGMVKIKAAGYDFEMGQPDPDIGGKDYSSIEQPVHTVSFTSDFWMDTVEVTQGDYDQLMSSTYPEYTVPTNRPFGSGENYPVYNVVWNDAILYCNARSKRDNLDTVYSYSSMSGVPGSNPQISNIVIDMNANGYRLPTEAEWEYACKGGTFTDFFWEKNLNDYQESADRSEVNSYAVWRGNSLDMGTEHPDFGTHLVGSGTPNAYGLYDMVGNVTEHCTDMYADYSYGSITDPFTPWASGQFPMLRGGHWGNDLIYLRSANRSFENTAYMHLLNGFRTVRRAD